MHPVVGSGHHSHRSFPAVSDCMLGVFSVVDPRSQWVIRSKTSKSGNLPPTRSGRVSVVMSTGATPLEARMPGMSNTATRSAARLIDCVPVLPVVIVSREHHRILDPLHDQSCRVSTALQSSVPMFQLSESRINMTETDSTIDVPSDLKALLRTLRQLQRGSPHIKSSAISPFATWVHKRNTSQLTEGTVTIERAHHCATSTEFLDNDKSNQGCSWCRCLKALLRYLPPRCLAHECRQGAGGRDPRMQRSARLAIDPEKQNTIRLKRGAPRNGDGYDIRCEGDRDGQERMRNDPGSTTYRIECRERTRSHGKHLGH